MSASFEVKDQVTAREITCSYPCKIIVRLYLTLTFATINADSACSPMTVHSVPAIYFPVGIQLLQTLQAECIVCLRFHREICFLAVCCIAKVCPSTKLQFTKPDVGEWSVSVEFLPLDCGDGPSGTQWIGGWLKTVPASDVMALFSQHRVTSCVVCV